MNVPEHARWIAASAPRGPLAITRPVSSSLARCEVTHIDRSPIDLARAESQHAAYCSALESAGLTVLKLPPLHEYPDACFVEDTAVALDECAILTSMGALSRRDELRAIEPCLRELRDLHRIELPAEIEGGDVLRVGRTLYVGLSTRTNQQGIDRLGAIVRPLGYAVVPVPVRGCLHLKTGCSALTPTALLYNPAWIDPSPFQGFHRIPVAPDEPWSGNVLIHGEHAIMHAGHARAARAASGLGLTVHLVDISELMKAEAGVTCLSIVLQASASHGRR